MIYSSSLEFDSFIGAQPKKFNGYDLKLGELAPEGESFVPWAALKKYPYTYIGNANRQNVCSMRVKIQFKLICTVRFLRDSSIVERFLMSYGTCEFKLLSFSSRFTVNLPQKGSCAGEWHIFS